MPASAARIGFLTEQYRRAVAQTPTATTRHGTLARESADPIETSLDSIVDAQSVATARQALLSVERRRFTCVVADIDEVLAMNYIGAVPVAQFVDTERDVDRQVLISEITIDFNKEQAALEIWG